MRRQATLAAVVIALVSVGSTAAAKGRARRRPSGSADTVKSTPEVLNRQLEWEEKVVGPKEKGVDHEKIAAMQAKARREEAAHQNDPPKKAARPEGVGAPSTATLP